MCRRAINLVDRQVITPAFAPLGPVKTLDEKHQRQDPGRNGCQPFIIFIGVVRCGRKQLDHRTQAAFQAQWLACRVTVFMCKIRLEALRVVLVENILNHVEVLVQIIDKQVPVNDGIIQGF